MKGANNPMQRQYYHLDEFASTMALAQSGTIHAFGHHYHAVNTLNGKWHPQGAITREDAAALVAKKWGLPLEMIMTIPCRNGDEPANCPILREAMEEVQARAWAELKQPD